MSHARTLPVGASWTRPLADERTVAILAYALALALGLALAGHLFPRDYLLGIVDLLGPPDADIGQNILVQRYFYADAWRWPVLVARNLAGPEGTNIGLIDGIPLIALPLKLLAPWLPAGFHAVNLWHAIAWVLQPVAAVWCLRGTRVRGLAPALAVAVMAASMPAWWNRFGHPALCGHFLLLLALGCYLRLTTRPGQRWWLGLLAVEAAALLTQPYLAVMVLAFAGAVPLTLLLRRDRRWPVAAAGALAVMAVLVSGLRLLDYLGVTGGYGFGEFKMDLLAPVWPSSSALFPWTLAEVGPWEGYNYLGAGLLLGLAATLLLRWQALGLSLRRHAGLALAMLALTMFALSQRPTLGNHLLADLAIIPDWLQNLRSTGRFFWPVAYAALLLAVVQVARLADRRLALGLLGAMAALQFADVTGLRHGLYLKLRQPPQAWKIDAPALRAMLVDARALTLLPTWYCVPVREFAPEQELLLQAILVASETAVPASTMDVPRHHGELACHDQDIAQAPLGRGEIRVLTPAARDAYLAMIPRADELCRPLGEIMACRDPRSTAPLGTDPPPPPMLRLGAWTFAVDADGLPLLGHGWSHPEPDGIWSVGERAELRFDRPAALAGPLALRLDLQGIAPDQHGKQRVEVWLAGEKLERWTLKDRRQKEVEVALPAGPPGPTTLELWIESPTRPEDRGLGEDARPLGIKLHGLSVARAP